EAYQYVEDQKALEWYDRAITRLGQEAELKEAAARIYENMGYDKLYKEKQYAESIQLLDKAIELRPNLAYAHNNRGNAYRRLGSAYRRSEKYEQAVKDYER